MKLIGHSYFKIFLVLFATFTVGISPGRCAPPDVTTESRIDARLNSISHKETGKVLEVMSKALASLGYENFRIIGGTARSLLSGIYANSNISFRDFDIALLGREGIATEEEVRRISESLASALNGKFDPTTIERRQRERFFGGKAENFNAGYGSFIDMPFGQIDVSLFHNQSALESNGQLSWDRIQILVDQFFSFSQFAVDLRSGSFQSLVESGRIQDFHHGWLDFLNKQARLVNRAALEAKTHISALRLLRDISKMGITPSVSLLTRIRSLFDRGMVPINIGWLIHNLDKTTHDPFAIDLLKTLSRVGFFSSWAPALGEFILKSDTQEIRAAMNYGDRLGLSKFGPLWGLTRASTSLRDRAWIIKGIAEFAPDLFFRHARILLTEGPSSLRVAYFTGDFGPFHSGHKSVVETVQKKRPDIDLIFPLVIPHPRVGALTEQFDSNEWAERVRFTQLGLDRVAKAVVIPWHQINFEKLPTTQGLIDFTDRQFSWQSPVIQVAGGDSLIRLSQMGFLESQPRKRIIVTRPGIVLTQSLASHHDVSIITNLRSQPTSSTWLMHEIAAGQRSETIDPLVYDYLMSLPRYRNIFNTLRRIGEEINQAAKMKRAGNSPAYLLNPYFIAGDQSRSRFSEPQPEHEIVLRSLLKKGNQIYVIGRDGLQFQDFKNSWERFLGDRGLDGIKIVKSESEVKENSRIQVMHTGDSVYNLEKIMDYMKNPDTSVIFYGNEADSPLSPLLKQSAFRVLRTNFENPRDGTDLSGSIRCRELLTP